MAVLNTRAREQKEHFPDELVVKSVLGGDRATEEGYAIT